MDNHKVAVSVGHLLHKNRLASVGGFLVYFALFLVLVMKWGFVHPLPLRVYETLP